MEEEKFRPKLSAVPNTEGASREFRHWKRLLNDCIDEMDSPSDIRKLRYLRRCLNASNYEIIANCTTYDTAIRTLNDAFDKPVNIVTARHAFGTRKQKPGETLDEYLRALHHLSIACEYKDITADLLRQERVRDTFIWGITDATIRERLLEQGALTLEKTVDTALAVSKAKQDAVSNVTPVAAIDSAEVKTSQLDAYQQSSPSNASFAINLRKLPPKMNTNLYGQQSPTTKINASKCYKCEHILPHEGQSCPAANSVCGYCHSKGHWLRVCPLRLKMPTTNPQLSYRNSTFSRSTFPKPFRTNVHAVQSGSNWMPNYCEPSIANHMPVTSAYELQTPEDVEPTATSEEIPLDYCCGENLKNKVVNSGLFQLDNNYTCSASVINNNNLDNYLNCTANVTAAPCINVSTSNCSFNSKENVKFDNNTVAKASTFSHSTIIVNILDQNCLALVDTGSHKNFISQKMSGRLKGLQIVEVPPIFITLAAKSPGTPIKPINWGCYANIRVGHNPILTFFSIFYLMLPLI